MFVVQTFLLGNSLRLIARSEASQQPIRLGGSHQKSLRVLTLRRCIVDAAADVAARRGTHGVPRVAPGAGRGRTDGRQKKVGKTSHGTLDQ